MQKSTLHTNIDTATSLFLGVEGLFAQRIVRAEGKAQVRMESDMSKEEAQELAEEQAMITAIDRRVRNLRRTTNRHDDHRWKSSLQHHRNHQSKRRLDRNARSFLSQKRLKLRKGMFGKENVIYVTCKIKGKIRESIPRAANSITWC